MTTSQNARCDADMAYCFLLGAGTSAMQEDPAEGLCAVGSSAAFKSGAASSQYACFPEPLYPVFYGLLC